MEKCFIALVFRPAACFVGRAPKSAGGSGAVDTTAPRGALSKIKKVRSEMALIDLKCIYLRVPCGWPVIAPPVWLTAAHQVGGAIGAFTKKWLKMTRNRHKCPTMAKNVKKKSILSTTTSHCLSKTHQIIFFSKRSQKKIALSARHRCDPGGAIPISGFCDSALIPKPGTWHLSLRL